MTGRGSVFFGVWCASAIRFACAGAGYPWFLDVALKTLDLSRNTLGVEGGKAIAEGIKGNVAVTSLNLGDNDIGPTGAAAIAEALNSGSVALKSLDVRYNSLGEEGKRVLRDAAKGRELH